MRKTILLLTLSLITLSFANAQDSLKLTLNEAQELAIAKNRQLKNSTLEIKKSEAQKWQTIASMLPQVSVGFDYTNQFGYELDFGAMSIKMPNSLTTAVTTAMALSAPQVIGIQLNNIAQKMASIQQKQTQREVTDQVKTLYFSALAMEETVGLLENNSDNLKRLHSYAEQSVKVGISEQTDADKISVQVATMQTTISATKRSLEMIYNAMRLQLGVSGDTEIELTNTIDELMSDGSEEVSYGDSFVLDNNFNYQLLQQSVELSKKQVALKWWDYAPTATVFHQYSNLHYFEEGGGFRMTPPNMFGISLKVPIFSSGMRYKAAQEAKLSYQQQLNTFDEATEGLKIQYRQLSYNYISAAESFDTQKQNMVVVQRVFDNISKKYENGMASSLEVTTSGTELIGAQSNYVKALLDVITAQIELEQLLNIK